MLHRHFRIILWGNTHLDYSAFGCKTTGNESLEKIRVWKKFSCVHQEYVYRPTAIWSLSPFILKSGSKHLLRTSKEIKNANSMCREPIANCYIKPWEEWMNKIQYVPFQPVSCLNSNLGVNVNKCLSFLIHICTSGCACATMSCCGSDLLGCRGNSLSEAGLQSRRKAQRCGLCVGERRHHMHSNSSMRCLVFPDRICLRVLYLSRPARMFSAWMMSFTVFLLSSRALANSELKAWK